MRRPLLLLMTLIIGQHSAAAEFAGYVALTTDYVKRGVSQSDSDPALQLGGDVSFTNGFYLGAWASTTDIENGPDRRRDREVNYYLGYAFDVSKLWRISANAVAYCSGPRTCGSCRTAGTRSICIYPQALPNLDVGTSQVVFVDDLIDRHAVPGR